MALIIGGSITLLSCLYIVVWKSNVRRLQRNYRDEAL